MAEELLIRTEGLCRFFASGQETVRVLDHIDLEIPAHRLTMLKGRSGSGKTTLINLLGALDKPTAGRIWFDGQEIGVMSSGKRDHLRRKRMGFVFQSIALIATMTAFENVDFGLRIAGFPASERSNRALEVLALVGLDKRTRHRTQELSGGEQQRVAIARAIAHRPSVIFADEPTAELDTAMGLQVVGLFRELVENQGLTVVMTTHDPNMMQLADQVISLDSEARP